MKCLILLIGVFCTPFLEARDVIKTTGGIMIQMSDSDTAYSDLLANVDIQYLRHYESNWTYGMSVGLYRMKDFYRKNDQGVDVGPKAEGFDSLYVCGRIGTSIRPAKFFYMDFITGPCYFDKAKELISGHIQFNTEASYGLRDPETGSFVGITYRHFSNGGMESPNYGANFYMLTMGIALD